MIDIFKRKTTVKDIESFEEKIANLIVTEFPQIKENLGKFETKIYFPNNGIKLMRTIFPTIFNKKVKSEKSFFELSGIYLTEKTTQNQKEIKLYYYNNRLASLTVENPEKFYKNYDLDSIIIKDLSRRNIKLQNSDLEIVSKILSSLEKEQLEILDLEDTFEIESDGKFYYPIVDMENGNYIVIDKKGKVYRLNHDDKEIVKEIFKNATDFLNIFNGDKSILNVYF